MKFKVLVAVALIVGLSGIAAAELQNVSIGGSIRIRGNYFNMDYARVRGGFFYDGGFNVVTFGKHAFIEQRTRLNVKADFTQDVSAFFEFDYYNWWGDDFRSNYLTGADYRAGLNSVDLYQAYIQAENMWGTPLAMRVGRQELAFGSQFLVGVNDASHSFTGLSFDALRLTYATDLVSIDAVAAKLAENYADFMDDDVDFYAVYGSYLGIDDVTLDAYWMFVRDDAGYTERFVDVNKVNLHTIGLRGAGVIGGFDFDLEAAYQFGNVYGVRNPWFRVFRPYADVDIDEFAVNAEVGYTFDMTMQPRVFARFAYLGGGKPNRSCWNNDYTMPFNRLFSNIKYSEFLDNYTLFQSGMTNVFFYGVGVEALVTEALEMKLVGSYYHADQYPHPRRRASKGLGWEVGLYADYHYSDDLVIRAGYAHFFGKRGLETARIGAHGFLLWGGDRNDDYDYVFVETEINF